MANVTERDRSGHFMKRVVLPLAVFLSTALAVIVAARPAPVVAQSRSVPVATGGPGAQLLRGVAAIIEADVTTARYYYDDAYGPRTEVTLANVVVHRGAPPATTSFTQLGGPLPSGEYLHVSELPSLNPGSRYVLFIMGGPWFYTPVWASLAFRVEKLGQRTIVVGPNGFAVTHFGTDGVRFGSTKIVDYSKPIDPLTARPVEAVDATSADLKDAIDVSSLAASANATLDAVGSSTDAVTFEPEKRSQWNVIGTVPPKAP